LTAPGEFAQWGVGADREAKLPRRRVVVATFGSAGDLFPLIPVVGRLQQHNCEVLWICNRTLGLFLRALGYRSVSVGPPNEFGAGNDGTLLTTRFDGWASWSRLMDGHIAPTLSSDISTVQSVFDKWRPDVVLASGFAVACREAALRHGIPLVDLSIYPQHQLAGSGRRLGHAVRSQLEADDWRSAERSMWGSPASAILAEPAFDPRVHGAIGYPYWDGLATSQTDHEEQAQWIESVGQYAVVCLGSFIGLDATAFWTSMCEMQPALRVSLLLVGARHALGVLNTQNLLTTAYMPLRDALHGAVLSVHHGGLGTTVASIAAGCPAVVVPHGFDQARNARIVEGHHAGLSAALSTVEAAIRTILGDRSYASAASDLSTRFVGPEIAADRAAAIVLGSAP